MSIPEKPTGPASYFPSIEKKYGHPISHWINLLKGQKDMKHMELVSWLKTVHQIGHGHANALVAHLKSNPESQLSRSSEKLQPAVHPLQPVIPMSQPVVHSYLFFSGNCAEALEFYKTALGAGIEMVMRFNESPAPLPPGMLAPGFEDKVMHASFRVGASQIMASDGCDSTGKFDGFSLSLALATEAVANRFSPPCLKAARSPCRSAKPSGPPASVCWRTNSGSDGCSTSCPPRKREPEFDIILVSP